MATEFNLRGSPDLEEYIKTSSRNEMSDRIIPITALEIYSVIHDLGFLGSVSIRVSETLKAIGYLSSVCSVILGAELARTMGVPCIVESDSGTHDKSSYSQYVLLQKVPGNSNQFEQNQEFQAIVHTSNGDLVMAVPTSNELALHPTLTPGSIQFKPINTLSEAPSLATAA